MVLKTGILVRRGGQVSLDERYASTINILSYAKAPLSAREIAECSLQDANSSDALAVGSILNVLVCAGIAKKHVTYKGKSQRVKYSLLKCPVIEYSKGRTK